MTDSIPLLDGQQREALTNCPDCDGRGWRPKTWIKEDPRSGCKCERCDGTGRVRG